MSPPSEITRLSVTELSDLVLYRELLPTEILEAHLRRIAEVNPGINAITDLQVDRAREQARLADEACRKAGDIRCLHGIPVTVKSSIAARGCRYECGTPLRREETAKQDAFVVKRLKEAGAIVLGTTNVPEFLMAYETDNALYGRTSSPFDPEFTPGGSSGGCAAAVAAGCSAASFGSDAGGSVRVPAHFCGLYGLKPTPGMIPRTGHWPAVAGPSTTLASVGPLVRTADDLNLFLRLTNKFDPADISCSRTEPPRAAPEGVLQSLRVGWFDHAWDTPVTPATRAAVRTAAEALASRGFPVERIELRGLEQAPKIWQLLFGTCLKSLIEGSVPSGYRLHPLAYDAMASDAQAAETTYQDVLWGWVAQDQLRAELLKQLRSHPLLLGPVAAIPAFRHGERSWSIEGQEVGYPGAFVYSQVFNVLGVPAASVPVGESPAGLPIGVQLVGRPHEDLTLVAAVRELEAGLRGE